MASRVLPRGPKAHARWKHCSVRRMEVRPAIHFAVREGHVEAVQLRLDAGADPEWNGLHDGSLIAMARDRTA